MTFSEHVSLRGILGLKKAVSGSQDKETSNPHHTRLNHMVLCHALTAHQNAICIRDFLIKKPDGKNSPLHTSVFNKTAFHFYSLSFRLSQFNTKRFFTNITNCFFNRGIPFERHRILHVSSSGWLYMLLKACVR